MENRELGIAFIGAGKVGCSLGKWFSEGGVRLCGYSSRTFESARFAADFTGSEAYTDIEDLVTDAGVIFLTAGDGELEKIARSLDKDILRDKILVHCSGSLSVKEVFKDRGNCFSLHPLYPFSSKTDCYKGLNGCFFTLESSREYDAGVVLALENMVKSCGGNVRRMDGSCKSRYHAACVFASNLVCGVLAEAGGLMESCGFEEADAMNALAPLIRANIEACIRKGPVDALTGPVERGDAGTVEKHIRALEGTESLEIYEVLSRKLTELGSLRHPERDYSEIKNLLAETGGM